MCPPPQGGCRGWGVVRRWGDPVQSGGVLKGGGHPRSPQLQEDPSPILLGGGAEIEAPPLKINQTDIMGGGVPHSLSQCYSGGGGGKNTAPTNRVVV